MNSLEFLTKNILTTTFFVTLLRVTTPILFAALGSVIASKSGLANIALEGIMLSAALFGVIGSGYTGSLFIGMICGILGGLIITALLIYFGLYLKTDFVLSGIALNMLAIGGTVFLLFAITGDRGTSVSLNSLRFPNLNIPFIEDIPVLGKLISGHNVLTYFAIISVFLLKYTLNKTTFGLRVRSVGENSQAAESVGINVRLVRVQALIISGVLASFGGMYMSMGYLSNFSRNMVKGRGFIALAADAMGQSTPIGVFVSSIIFGAADALSFSMQSLNIPSNIVKTVPYVTTIVGLVIYSHFKMKHDMKRKKLLQGGRSE